MDQQKDEKILELLAKDSNLAFKLIFDQYYKYLCLVVFRMIQDRNLAEDIVQDVMHDFWKKHENIEIKSSLKSYLHRSTVNKTLNHIRDKKMTFEEEEQIDIHKSQEADIDNLINAEELQNRINQAIGALPERCRIIFSLSRFEELSYKEIAETLEISVKTVENQMSKALRILRKAINR